MTHLFLEAESEGPALTDKIFPIVYQELRAIAHNRMAAEPAALTLQTTALVHEAYLRLLGDEDLNWENRRHFFSAAATAMRRILIEQARKRAALKRGGRRERIALDDADISFEDHCFELIALDEGLQQLEQKDARKAQVVMLRFFGGLTIEDTAHALGISITTVKDDWHFARAWLQVRMGQHDDDQQ